MFYIAIFIPLATTSLIFSIKSSISFGVVIGDKDIEFDNLYEMADKLLYEMKRNNKGTYKILNIYK